MRSPDQRGASLPTVLLALTLMSLTVAVSFSLTSSERKINGDQQAQIDAFAVAQSGLQAYRTAFTALPGATHDSTITALPGGSAEVSLRRIRDTVGTTPALFVISSRGTSTSAVRYSATTPPAQRTVAQYMIWQPGTMDIDAAFTSLSGVDKNGNSGALDGNDGCAGSGIPPIAGVAVPTGLYTGHTNPINGNPDNAAIPLGTAGTAGTAKDEVHVDWAGIVAGTALTPDVVLPGGSWPTAAEMLGWPIIFANGNLSVTGGTTDSKGILIVTGDFTMSGSYRHEGIVLVGGTLTSNGNNQIHGAVITGLNIKLGIAVPQTAVGNGNKTFRYNSCNVALALGALGSLEPIGNGWLDDYPSY